jgi:hypothetical protein
VKQFTVKLTGTNACEELENVVLPEDFICVHEKTKAKVRTFYGGKTNFD